MQVRGQGGKPVNPEQQLKLDKISSLYSKVYDKLEAEERFDNAKRKVEEEESGWGVGERLTSVVRDRELHDEDLLGGRVKSAEGNDEGGEEEEAVQRRLLANMNSQIKDTEGLFRTFEAEDSHGDQKLVDELRSRAMELVTLKDEIDQTRPGWVDAVKGEANHARAHAEALFRLSVPTQPPCVCRVPISILHASRGNVKNNEHLNF